MTGLRTLMRVFIRIAGIVSISGLLAPGLFAWGCEGHQAIAIMAENMMPSGVAQRINELLAAHPGPKLPRTYCDVSGLSPLAQAATWADDFRDVDRSTGQLHFIDIPIALRQPPDLAAYCKEGCVVDAIRTNLEKFKTATNDDERATALRFLIHFVGDVHQPLHSSTNNDRGGNCVAVSYYSLKAAVSGPQDVASPNLHSIWDSNLLRTFMRRKDFTVETIAEHLQKEYARRIRRWAAVQDPAAWALDAFERSRTVTYGALPAHIRAEDPVEVKTCADDNHIAQRTLALNEQIDDVYLDSAIPVVQVQLAKAAARLARMLEDAVK